jgi:hypothetical protein
MQPVKLYTADGGFVVEGQVPAFLKGLEAEVIIWGERLFKLDRVGGAPHIDKDGALVYKEIFFVALVNWK